MEKGTITRNNSISNTSQYIVITMKGFEFAEKLYEAEDISPRMTRRYQFLLWLIWMKGILPFHFLRRIGYSENLIAQALSRGYVEKVVRPQRLPKELQQRITAMIGKAPKKSYA